MRVLCMHLAVLAGLALMAPVAPSSASSEAPLGRAIEGAWQGTLRATLRVVVKISRDSTGVLGGTLDSPDQGAMGLPIDTLMFANDSLRFEMQRIRGAFAGRMSADGGEIAGQWQQGGATLPLTLKRLEKEPEYRRPQEPKKPYPYDEQEVVYENAKAGVRLTGTLTTPLTGGPFPCVLLITGSGPEDRDEAVFGHRPFLVLADHLTRHGIAVLRVDDRGVGGSTGTTTSSTSEDFAADVQEGIAFLRARTGIDPRRIGLIGHSEGGLIAPMVAARSKEIAFIVLMAAPGVPGDSIIYTQGALLLKAAGASDAVVTAQRRLQERLFAQVRENSDTTTATSRIREAFEEVVAGLPAEERGVLGDASAFVELQRRLLRSPWFRFILTYDPRPVLQEVTCPVLAINGERDLQVSPRENLGAIETALHAGSCRDFTVKELPRLNHLFQTCETGAISEYARIEETIAPVALEEMTQWILRRTAAKR